MWLVLRMTLIQGLLYSSQVPRLQGGVSSSTAPLHCCLGIALFLVLVCSFSGVHSNLGKKEGRKGRREGRMERQWDGMGWDGMGWEQRMD